MEGRAYSCRLPPHMTSSARGAFEADRETEKDRDTQRDTEKENHGQNGDRDRQVGEGVKHFVTMCDEGRVLRM